MSQYTKLKNLDFAHLWHPFTQASVWQDSEPLIVERAAGNYLFDVEGKSYLDGISSLWCNVHGHGKSELVSALKSQSELVCHSTLLGLSHRSVLELTEKLLHFVPSNLTRVFYSDSGSAAVEAALRICLEWWQKQGGVAAKKKTKLLSLETAYHGDTLGAVGVGYVETFHRMLAANVVPALRVSPPHYYRFYEGYSQEQSEEKSLTQLRQLLDTNASEIAAFIIEPLVQGAAGIWIHSASYLREVAALVKSHDVLLIADEVATGFGKTGAMFAIELAGINPDVLVVAKGLSGGYVPISAAITSEELYQGFIGPIEDLKTFYYGQTFAGNPLASAVSLANLKLFESDNIIAQLRSRLPVFHDALDRLISPLAQVDEVRRQGVMVGVELTAKKGGRESYPAQALAGSRIVLEARKLGAIVRPIGNVLVLMPAVSMPEKELIRLVEITAQAIPLALN